MAAETAAAGTSALIVDRSSDTKIAVRGAGSDEWLASRVTFPTSARSTEARAALFRGRTGEIEAMGRILPWDGAWLLTVDPEQETRLKGWLRAAHCPDHVHALDLTAALALLEIHGPAATSLVPHASFTRDPAHDSHLLTLAVDAVGRLWPALRGGGTATAPLLGGHFAEEALRIAHGIPRFGRETSAFRREPAHLAAYASPSLPGFGAREAIVCGDQVVGELTSRAAMPGWPATLSLALVRPEAATSAQLEFVAAGRRWPLTPRSTRWQVLIE